MGVPESIIKLCETFELHKDHYKSSGYNETELRREFLDPFFKALGWDVDNEQGYADAYKDVIHEDAIKIGGLTKAPDYCFRVGGTRKFFVEAKKPSVDIKGNIAPAYQLRRYGWSAKLPLSILSDFEELAVYDTRVRPAKNDKSSKARILYFRFEEYAEKWDKIAAVFSRKAVLKGSFDKYADTSKKKRGTGEVDDAFLEEIERWRTVLARNLALRNPSLSVRDMNFAVQKIIDRLIFLRICEDRGTEDYGRLLTLCNGGRTYIRLLEQFQQADNRYNSGLFHFDNGEKGRAEAPDTLTPDLTLDDAVLKDILKNLYYPDSPYEFSVLPADILGQVYEQFLGKTISLTTGHQAKIEEKPEVRKAGGVYYTPSYIVDYIVKNTLGRLLDGDEPEKPKPITVSKAADIKVLDPACGSGSFLIVAYQYLLDWHLRQYTVDPTTVEPDEGKIKRHAGGKNPKIYQASGGIWRLTTAERKRILLNNIHGVDIDSQAVEVTKLSLLLKVLEGETQQKLQRDFIRERQRILPDLGNNIKCGNSLIGPDFYNNEQMLLLDEETQYRINVFDWNDGFPDIMRCGGFDCVIGNPPYVLMQVLERDGSFAYLRENFTSATYKIDTYQVFIEQAIRLLQEKGYLGYITPNTFLRNVHSEPLRRILLELGQVKHMRNHLYSVFSGASVDTCIFSFKKGSATLPTTLIHAEESASPNICSRTQIEAILWLDHPHREFGVSVVAEGVGLLEKIRSGCKPLGSFADAYFGIQTYNRKEFVSECPDFKRSEPVIDGGHIQAYFLRPCDEWVDYCPEAIKSGGKEAVYMQDRLVTRQIGARPIVTFCPAGVFSLNTVYNIYFSDLKRHSMLYFLSLINSRLLDWYWKQSFYDGKKTFPKIKKRQLLSVPVRPIDFDNPDDVAMHDKMVSLVERMLELNKKKADEKNPNILKQLETQIAATDRQIDQLVYKLYDLTEDEIALVGGGT